MRRVLIVIAKAPVPGRSKTRLCPPCTPGQAAGLAAAALADTLAAVRAAPADRRVLVLDGVVRAPPGVEVMAQRGSGLAERLAHAFADIGEAALLVGMDTPQLTPTLLSDALDALASADAVLGRATDGGYWAIGLRAPDPRVFAGVPMSAPDTGARQAERLRALGLHTAPLAPLRDVDTIADAHAVAALAPQTRFAEALAGLELDEAA